MIRKIMLYIWVIASIIWETNKLLILVYFLLLILCIIAKILFQYTVDLLSTDNCTVFGIITRCFLKVLFLRVNI